MAFRFCLRCGARRASIIQISVNGCSDCPPESTAPVDANAPDLHTQLEDLLNVVGEQEADWRLDERINREMGYW